MEKETRKACCLLVIVMLILAIIANAAFMYILPQYKELSIVANVLSVFFSVFGILTILTLDKNKDEGNKYGRMFMLLKGLKLFITIIGAVVYAFFHRSLVIPFITMFVVYYITYSVFEATVLLKLNKDYQKEK